MNTYFKSDIGFCHSCGAILPTLPESGDVKCIACKHIVKFECFSEAKASYTIVFNKREKDKINDDDDEAEGPTVERKCVKCGHEKMSYAALQLRSADEGQTVFFTCLKCKYKESENS